jgi:hypothetical protein
LNIFHIPFNVTTIGSSAFQNCTGLQEVTIPNTGAKLRIIESYAFRNCTNLTTFPLSYLSTIETGAFYNCRSLSENAHFGILKTLGECAFEGCQSLTSICIPRVTTSIGTSPFAGCSNIESITVEEDNSYYDSRDNCNAIIQKNYSMLISGCKNSTIPSSVIYIGDGAFRGNSNLTSIAIPESVRYIDEMAFEGCSGLVSVSFSNCTIYDEAFANCNNLTAVTSYSPVPPDGGSEFSNRHNATLYVPYGCKAAYKAAYYWSDFKEILEMAPTEVDVNIGSAGIATYCSEFDLDFTKTDVKAYIVSAFTPRTGKVILTRIYDVPAGTGIVVMGDEGEHQIPVVEAQTVVSNMLVGVTEATELNKVDGDYTNYVFAQKSGELGFYAVADGSTLGAHKAYLPLPTAKLPSADSRVAYVFDGDDATEIQNIGQEDNVQHSIYNLNGQRQKGLKKGLNIVDGKKLLVK